MSLANEAARKAADQVRGGTDFNALARSLGLEISKTNDFTTADSVPGLGPAGTLNEAFLRPVGTVIGPVSVQDRNIVYKIVAQQPADPKNFAYERDVAVQELKQQKARAMYDLFQDGILNQARVDGKLKIHQDAIRQIVATYAR
jgi:hypothetical protein